RCRGLESHSAPGRHADQRRAVRGRAVGATPASPVRKPWTPRRAAIAGAGRATQASALRDAAALRTPARCGAEVVAAGGAMLTGQPALLAAAAGVAHRPEGRKRAG